MIYVPSDWLVDIENREAVYEIFEKYSYSDLVESGADNNQVAKKQIKALEEIGETVIADKIKNDELPIMGP
jgi:hypothetical protein